MTNRKKTINDLTREQLEEYLASSAKRKVTEKRECLYCGETTTMRADQIYCSSSCRVKAFKVKSEIETERLRRENEKLKAEILRLQNVINNGGKNAK